MLSLLPTTVAKRRVTSPEQALNPTRLFLPSGQKPVQEAFNREQRGDPHSSANGRRLAQIQNHSGQRQVGAREQRDSLVNQVLPCELTPSPSSGPNLAVALRCVEDANAQFAPRQGGKEYLMRAHFGLPSVEAEDKEGKPPISVKFEIPYFTTSGIQVHPALSPAAFRCLLSRRVRLMS